MRRICYIYSELSGDHMNTKGKLLELLEANRGSYFSGEEIAGLLSVSRTAVWKAVKSLQKEGYPIDAVTNKGYCLSLETDILSSQGIQKYLHPNIKNIDISLLPTVSSTNTLMKAKADANMPEGCLLIASEQTNGKGRYRRNFYSPHNTGIYMSLLLRPQNCTSVQAAQITTIAAVAMCEAIEAVSGERAEIKWVNDILIRGKKVCGILTEGSFNLETGALEYAVLGLGLNLYEPEEGFPKALISVAGTVFHASHSDAKNRLAAEFLNFFSILSNC
ncbi:Bifunctional ligase/repressor BirA [Eubacterium plexicaudatum ASF492]|nr:Bifunctional ligase/repressor BirA [Eubacterium plexicaudatum ASF492]